MNLLTTALLLLLQCQTAAWIFPSTTASYHAIVSVKKKRTRRRTTTRLSMGLFDGLSKFLSSREGDFVQLNLDETTQPFGPGPLMLLYHAPEGIDNEEIHDMLHDSAPTASSDGVTIVRLADDASNAALLDTPLESALETLAAASPSLSQKTASTLLGSVGGSIAGLTPVLYFSGFANREMMQAYNLLGAEIYKESGGTLQAACARAVPGALHKPLRQVLEEICGDHRDALRLTQQEEEEEDNE